MQPSIAALICLAARERQSSACVVAPQGVLVGVSGVLLCGILWLHAAVEKAMFPVVSCCVQRAHLQVLQYDGLAAVVWMFDCHFEPTWMGGAVNLLY
jgi:hypothetical protein